MISLQSKINEELILERIGSFIDDFKFSVDIISHAEDREMRHKKDYISKIDIGYSIAKVAKDIRNDIDSNFINIKDRIQIIDKSRGITLNILVDINKNLVKENYIKLTVITVMKGNMPTHDVKKIYNTYSNDSKVKSDVKFIKNEI